MINLISDTVTLPSKEMMQAMMNAPLGDDVFGADPSINELQNYAAELFGMEAALFCPSGTMTNQIAIKVHTQPLDEMICDHYSHVYQYESSGFAYNSGISVNLLEGSNGKISAEQIEPAIKDDYDWLPNTSLVVLENTCNKGGGSFYTLDEIKPIQKLCKDKGLKLHLDGARLFNALVETNEAPAAYGEAFDSISICLSKGLGAPVGSLLLGNAAFIKKAKRFRKVMGGGMRQAGLLAAAGLFALKNNVERLKIDNDRAKELGASLEIQDYVQAVRPVKSNIVIFDLKIKNSAEEFLNRLKAHGILASAFGPSTIRFVLHLDVSSEMHEKVLETIKSI
jgi:threonine aldolase